MKLAGNRDVLKYHLQVLHVPVFLIAPLSTGHIAQPDLGQHKRKIAVREIAHHTSAVVNRLVQSFNDIIGTDTSLVFAEKIAVSQRFFSCALHLLGCFFQLYEAQSFYYGLWAERLS